MGRWAQAEEVESIGQRREVWIEERVAVIEKGKTWAEQVKAVEEEEEEEEGWIVTSLARPSLAGPQSDRVGLPGASF